MYLIYEDECAKAGIDIKKVKSILRRLSRPAKDAAKLELTIFAGSGGGSLRFNDQKDNPQAKSLVLGYVDGGFWDGGDGATQEDEDGFMRGE